MTHTPTPWAFNESNGEIVYNDGGDVLPVIATVHSDNVSDEQFIGDGNLIIRAVNAHADLLAALESACESFAQLHKLNRLPAGENNAGWRDCRAAIAKAKGS